MESLAEKITKAQEKRDIERLRSMHHALTKSRVASYYAGLTPDEAERAAAAVAMAIAELDPNQKQRKPRQPPKPPDAALCGGQHGLFADTGRWPRKPYCTDVLKNGLIIRPLHRAVLYKYLQPNPPHLRTHLLFDIDRPGAAIVWEQAGLLPPTWTATNPENGHAHLVWDLSAPVLVDGLGARDAPMRYLSAVEAVMTKRLGADPDFVGLITKNPAHPSWEVTSELRSYTLGELASVLPGIEKYRPSKKPEERVGSGKNVMLFDALRKDCYSAIRRYWGGGLSGWNAWLSHCNAMALCMNADMFGFKQLQGNEVWYVSKSVAKWVWRKFTPDEFSAWQAAQGSKGGKKGMLSRWGDNEDKRASARIMRSGGMTQAAIAAELNVHVNTVANWLRGDPQ